STVLFGRSSRVESSTSVNAAPSPARTSKTPRTRSMTWTRYGELFLFRVATRFPACTKIWNLVPYNATPVFLSRIIFLEAASRSDAEIAGPFSDEWDREQERGKPHSPRLRPARRGSCAAVQRR